MAITEIDEELIELGFEEAFSVDESKEIEMADKAMTAWNNLWALMIRENNFSNKLGSKVLDWQIGNWAQDLCMTLHNAGRYQDLIKINEQILRINWLGYKDDNIFHENAKRDIADAYADMGDIATCYKLYEGYLKDEPLWGWGWIGYYRQFHDNRDSRFEDTINNLYLEIKKGVIYQDMEDLCRELSDEFEQLGEEEKASFCKIKEKEISPPIKVNPYLAKRMSDILGDGKKIYPNESCPCGSGKKYKKCCGK